MAFGTDQLTEMIAAGRVSEHDARIWVRVARPGRYTIALEELEDERRYWQAHAEIADGPEDGTAALVMPARGEGLLRPHTRYATRLLAGDECLAAAEFTTAPPRGRSPRHRWSFGMFSCHQPFASRDGSPLDEAVSMLDAACGVLRGAPAEFVLMLGDQTYNDQPSPVSLYHEPYFAKVAPPGRRSMLECTREEVRRLVQERHRIFWASEGFRRIQRSFACYPMLDDHEIVDNFGTNAAHDVPEWSTVRDGALDAVYDYQIARVLPRRADGSRPPHFDYGFAWGNAAVWMMDVRSCRRTRNGVTDPYGEEQLEQLVRFMAEHRDCKVLVLATPVPLVHVEGKVATTASHFLSAGSDLHERWSHEQSRRARDRLLSVIIDHARMHEHQRVLLVGGDVHAGAAFEVPFRKSGLRFLQFTSSAISNREGLIVSKAAELAAKTCPSIDLGFDDADCRLLKGAPEVDHNPFGKLNLGMVDVIDRGRTVGLRLRLFSHDGSGHPVTVFDTGEI